MKTMLEKKLIFLFPSTFNVASSQQGLYSYTWQDHIYVEKNARI